MLLPFAVWYFYELVNLRVWVCIRARNITVLLTLDYGAVAADTDRLPFVSEIRSEWLTRSVAAELEPG